MTGFSCRPRRVSARFLEAALAAGLWLTLAGVSPCAAQDGDERLAGIQRMIQAGRLSAAEQALESLPDRSPRADYLLGFTLIQLYRFEEAQAALERATRGEDPEPAWLHALAKALQEQGKNRAAIEVLDRALAIGDHPDYRFAKAMCALNVGDLDAAEAELERCLEKAPRHAEALYKLGRLRADRGDYAASLGPLRESLAARPDHVEARFLLGLAASRTGDLPAAAEAFESVLERVSGHVGALYNLGQVRIRQGRREEGLERLAEFRSMSELRDAIDFTTRAVKKNPANVDGRLELGRLLLSAGRAEDALNELTAARPLAPRRSAVYRLMAEAFDRLGRTEDAARAAAFANRLEGAGG